MSKVRSVNIVFEKAQYLQRQRKSFTLNGTNGRYELISEYYGEKIVSKFKSNLTPKELNFIKKVKKHVISKIDTLNFFDLLNHTLIKYVDTKKYENGTVFNDVYEVDIDEAYWMTAKLNNVISEEIYNEGNKASEIKKQVRLIALGSLAKKVYSYNFSGSKIMVDRAEIKRSLLTENIWYTICQKVSKIMIECQDTVKNDFIMFWVDGVYFRGEENVKKIQEIIESYGYASKIKKMHKVEYKEDRIWCYENETDTEKEVRSFNLPKNKNKLKPPFPKEELNKTAIKYSKFID